MWCRSLIAGLALFTATAEADWSPLVAEVIVNGQGHGVAVLMQEESGALLADEATLEHWRVRGPWPDGELRDGRAWHSLDDIAGLERKLDPRSLTLEVTFPPELFPVSVVGGGRDAPLPEPPSFGGWLDYDFGYFRGELEDQGSWSASLNPTLFGPAGYLSSGFLWRDLGQDVPGDGWLRLDTTWSTDFPARMLSLRAGDSVTGAGAWRRGVRFGGLQLATNFDTRPRMATFPQPSVRGSAVLPTTLEILLNGEPRGTANLPPGGWALEDLPVAAGSGEVTVISRDLAGREQVYTLDFYASRGLLRPGLNEFSVAAGRIRQDYGLENFEYGDAFASAGWRRGMTDRLTFEAAAESTGDMTTAGSGFGLALPALGMVSLAAAASRDGGDQGALWQLGLERRTRRWSFGFGVQQTTPGFRQLGYHGQEMPARRTAAASAGVDLASAGSLSLTFADQVYHDVRRSRLVQLNWMRSFDGGFNAQAFLRRLDGTNEETTLGVVFSKTLGERRTASASLQSVDGQFEAVAELNQQLPADHGAGYRLRSTAGRSARQEAYFSANAGTLRFDGDVRRTSGGTGMSGFVGGSLAWMDGFYAARQIRDSFAIVDTGGVPDVRVYRENQEVGRTGKDGRLLVPALRPFDVNRLSLELTDLPLDARLDHSVRHVVPFGRSGTSVDFGVVRTRSAVLHLLDAAGEPVPAGAVARAGEAELPVGYGGMVYLPDAAGVEILHVRWPAGRCDARLPPLPDAEPLPDLGSVACQAD